MDLPLNRNQLRDFLESKLEKYNQPGFVPSDPISIPHRYTQREDIEVSGFLTALIAWGRRDMILKNARRLMERMDDAPGDFVREATDKELRSLSGFVHRTFQGEDAVFICKGLQHIYRDLGGLERVMGLPEVATHTELALVGLREAMAGVSGFPDRTFKHLANPRKGSSAKRLNMFLRWMVRKDRQGVDFGLWESLRADQLVCPLDVHTGNVGRKLGLLHRKQNDWKAALELTDSLREMDSHDPVKYDIALFSLGVEEGF